MSAYANRRQVQSVGADRGLGWKGAKSQRTDNRRLRQLIWPR